MGQSRQGPVEALREKAFGFIAARSIYAVAKLGIADLIKDGSRTAEELADKTGGDAYAQVVACPRNQKSPLSQ